MNYYKVIIPIPNTIDDTEILIAQLSVIGFESFEEQLDNLIAYIPENEYDKNTVLTVDYCNTCEKSGSLLVDFIPDQNWNKVWESNYPPVIIADKCYIRAPFHESRPSMEYEILIKPKMAFGTAHHETTSLILEYILKNDFINKKVLDMGCGTGILAILASFKGAASITAIDNDKWSFENSTENIDANRIENINVILGGCEAIPDNEKYDIILANINKNILLRDMKFYNDALIVGGEIVFSGYYDTDLSDIELESRKYGLKLINKFEKNRWTAAQFIKHN